MREYGYKGNSGSGCSIPVKEGFLDAADKVWVVVSDDEIRLSV